MLLERAKKMLSNASLRQTAPRLAVIQTLLQVQAPVSQDQIAEALGNDAPNKVTIYRVLESLVNAGLVHKAYLKERTWHFELAHNCSEHQCHPHFTCTECGQTSCLPDLKVPMAQNKHNGYIIQHQQVQLEGLCPQCSQDNP